jgi:hypothetical protein
MADASRVRSWIASAIVAGFVGAFLAAAALVVGYAIAPLLAAALPGAMGSWFTALTSNVATSLTANALGLALLVHAAVGLLFALVYAAYVEPRLSGPGWWRGVRFALLPWALSLLVFLPAVGGGVLGLDLGAGPLPILGNLIAHLAYGAGLGWLYERDALELRADDPASAIANAGAERGMAIGVVAGGAVGALIGYALAGPSETVGATVLAGAAIGATLAGFLGSYLGLSGPAARAG